MWLADAIANMGPFELISDGSTIPVFAFRLKHEVGSYTVFDVSEALRLHGWQVPAYTLPANLQDTAVLRVVVRNGFGQDLAQLLGSRHAACHRASRRHRPSTPTRAAFGIPPLTNLPGLKRRPDGTRRRHTDLPTAELNTASAR